MPFGRTACLLVIAAAAALLLPLAPGAIRKTGWRNAITRLVRLLARGAGDAAGSLVEAGVEIGKEDRVADEVRCQTIASQIEAARSRDYADLAKA